MRSDNKNSFLGYDKPMITGIIQRPLPDEIIEMGKQCIDAGADAVGIQLESLLPEYQDIETMINIISKFDGIPLYLTNYRRDQNTNRKSDEQLAEELLKLADVRPFLCDVMGDQFCPTEGEITYDNLAVKKQEEYIEKLHSKGCEVLMSSHILKFTDAENVLKTSFAHQSRGADISKIVTFANNMDEQLENLKITNLLKEKLDIPFLFLSGGECHLHRMIGPMLGCTMYLSIHHLHDKCTPTQPIISNLMTVLEKF